MGDLITCPSCHGWPSNETGMDCFLCGNEGVIWDDDAEGGEPMPEDDEEF